MTLLSVDGLTVALPAGADRPHAVEDVSFTLDAGEILCIVGEHNPWLVVLAALVCVSGATVTFRLFAQALERQGFQRAGWTFLAAMAGGLLIGVTDLGLTPEVYIERTHDMLTLQHVGSGLVKAFCFGLAIVLIACHRGLATEGGAEGVGTSTTQSVVQIIFQIVVLESLFTVLFNFFGI